MEQIKTQKRSLEYPEFMHRPCRTHRALVREHVRIERARDMRRQRLLRRILLLILVIAGISIAVIAGLRFSAYNINAGSSSRYVKGYKSVEIPLRSWPATHSGQLPTGRWASVTRISVNIFPRSRRSIGLTAMSCTQAHISAYRIMKRKDESRWHG